MGGFHGFGSTIIDSYLKGLHYRQQHEEQIAQRQLEQKRIDQSQKQFLDTLELHKKTADLQFQHQKLSEDLAREHVKQAVLESIAKGQTKVPEPVEQTPDMQNAAGSANLNSQPTSVVNPSTGQPSQISAPQFSTEQTIRPPMQIGTGVTAQTLTGDQYRTPAEQGAANAALLEPTLELKQKEHLQGLIDQFTLNTEALKQKTTAATELQKLKGTQAIEKETLRGTNLVNAANARAKLQGLKDRYLSPEEISKIPGAKLGDTIQTVKGQEVHKVLPQAEQAKFETNGNILTIINEIKDSGEKSNYNAVGRVAGLVGPVLGRFSEGGDPNERIFRTAVANLDLRIGEMLAGRTLTANEEVRLKKFIPSLFASKTDFKSKLSSLENVFHEANASLLKPAARRGQTSISVDELVKKHGGQ